MKGNKIPTVGKRDRAAGDDLALRVGCEASRTMRVQRTGEGEARQYACSLSSSTPVDQYFGREVLVHTAEAINLERAADGLVVLFNHDTSMPIGRGYGVHLADDGMLRCDSIKFSQRADAQGYRQDIDDDVLRDVSIRYTIDAYREEVDEDGNLTVYVTRWTPLEFSIVPIPADPTVGQGRKLAQRDQRGGQGDGNNPIDLAAWRRDNQAAAEAERNAATEAERGRVTNITAAFALCRQRSPELDRLRDHCINSGASLETAQRMLLEYINQATGIGDMAARGDGLVDSRADDEARRVHVSAGADASDKRVDAGTRAVAFRAGLLEAELKGDPAKRRELSREMRANPFAGLTLRELAREMLRERGLRVSGDPHQIVGWALAPWTHPDASRAFTAGMGTSDLTAILENNANKALLVGWDEAPETWSRIVRIGSLPDYKAGTRAGVGGLGSLQSVNQHGEYQYAYLTDVKEPIQLARKGVLVAFTREAIINDDLDALVRVPLLCGRAANRAIGDAVYALLTANAALAQDSVALFHSGSHGNIGSAGSPSVARLDEADKLLALQKSPGANETAGLNMELAKLIVPRALKGTSLVLAAAQYDPAGSAGTLPPNRWQNNFEVVSDVRLDATSASVYYASADPMRHDTLEVAFLNGNQEPYLDSQEGWKSDGIEWKVRHEFGAAVLDYRGLVRFPG